jgi:hypothetical protein
MSQQYSSLRTNQHQPSATSQTNRLNVIDNRIMFSVNFFMDLWVLLSTPFTLIQLASMPYKPHRADFLSTPFTLIMFSVDEKWVARWHHA